ncbi:MAG: hypothetical protein JKY56_06390, partial [Kofleriaceae bacterium]|nr:hypothetical protein [Kofleriaceae bacterium]
LSLSPGASVRRHTEKEDLNADLPCISCPFLLAYLDGTFVELGQILIDRYNSGRAGTDRKTTRVSVEAGVVRVLLKEREPETSFINVVEVWADGNKLPPMATVPVALIVDDLASHIMKNGDEIELEFAAPIKRGYLNVEIRVSGYYQLDRFASVR